MEKRETIYLSEEELTEKLPKRVGNINLDYSHYAGKDLYSDGAIEDELLQIAKEHSTVEFSRIIEERNSWPILYHLSPLRGNILEWLPINRNAKVLEIGSGCGAITETLVKKAGEVTCVDLSAKRSLVNAYRNQTVEDAKATIHVGNFKDIEPDLSCDYDYACMIGVFEYGQSYMGSETPYEDFLSIMLKHVKPGGRVIIAIENKYGLKYFAGCKEDHLGTWFSGIEGYPQGGSARTFSRKGLEKIMKSCDQENYEFYYPYPDYKFPTSIYSDNRLPGVGELTDNIRNFDRDRMILFNEKYAFDELIKDGLFPEHSNSYMVVIGKPLETSYVKYSNDRDQSFAIRTDIVNNNGVKTVRKYPLTQQAKEHVLNMEKTCKLLTKRYEGSGFVVNPCKWQGEYAEFEFASGVTLTKLLDECLDKKDMDTFYKLFDRFMELVCYKEEEKITDYDMIFSNILVDGSTWTIIDYEWAKECSTPAKELAFRSIYCYILEEEKRNALDLDQIIDRIQITSDEAEEFREKEKAFQHEVTGKRKSMGEIRAALGTYLIQPLDLCDEYLQKILDNRVQIYTDFGTGYSEESSYYISDVYQDGFHGKIEVNLAEGIKKLRIDPADRPCIMTISSLTIEDKEILTDGKLLSSNGKNAGNASYLFETTDPNIELDLNRISQYEQKKSNQKLKMEFSLTHISKEISDAVSKRLDRKINL